MSRPAKLPPGVIRACAGLLESEEALSLACRRAIQAAENAVGSDYLPEAEQQRRQLIQAIKLSLVNRKEWPYEALARTFDLSMSYNAFGREKKKFCYVMATGAGLVRLHRRPRRRTVELCPLPEPGGEGAGPWGGQARQGEAEDGQDDKKSRGGKRDG